MTNPPQRILVVGDDDICTAPFVAALLRTRLAGRDDVRVASAGLDGVVGQPACDHAIEAASAGADLRDHRSEPVTAERIRKADLVLTIDGEERSLVNRMAPGFQTKVFALREASTIAQAGDRWGRLDAVAAVAERLHRDRGLPKPKRIPVPRRGVLLRPVVELGLDDLPEAHHLDGAAHGWALEQARAAAAGIAAVLVALRAGAASAA
ncbi:hypothetical protein [Amnibacterium kyonggiense]|uniref:Protein-tyrosine-phosphatase n=1 Tax=Amnibacterium kyonggiense TaxID=595671 RepID=A0A4R7FIW5_9MICO|nr:hypothetical protein [Amnibacterium kyonggiense]TDS74892.1 protein-tyrosine-phosphatase [Amnibacterium kyonggiense]